MYLQKSVYRKIKNRKKQNVIADLCEISNQKTIAQYPTFFCILDSEVLLAKVMEN